MDWKRKMEWKAGIKCRTSRVFRHFHGIQNMKPFFETSVLKSLGTFNPQNPDSRSNPRGILNGNIHDLIRTNQ